uniref:Uncharacterized protein n=1 Tax=Moniliophthora roreri TaxID=221103 RepID=A0A0W0FH49_MONRR
MQGERDLSFVVVTHAEVVSSQGSPLEVGTLRYGKILRTEYGEEVEWRHWSTFIFLGVFPLLTTPYRGCVTPDILLQLGGAGVQDVRSFSELKLPDQHKIRKAVAARAIDPSDVPRTARNVVVIPPRRTQNLTNPSQKRKAPPDSTLPGSSGSRVRLSRPSTSYANISQPSLSQNGDDDAGNNEVEVGDELYCTTRTKVVGIQYYTGLVGPEEEVILQREPQNRFDRNAIQVLNIGRTQVGHLPRDIAAKLSPLLDAGKVSVEGVIHDGNLMGGRGVYTLAMSLKIYGPLDKRAELEPRLTWATPGRRDFPPRAGSSAGGSSSGGYRSASAAGYGGYSGGGHVGGAPPAYNSYNTSRAAPSLQTPEQIERARKQQEALRKAAELKEMLNSLERVDDEGRRSSLLDTVCSSEDVLELPLHSSPPSIESGDLKVDLLKHQKQGLQWCIECEYPVLPKEESDKPVQFWQVKIKANGTKYYYNIATKTPTETPPVLGRGALFADAMGLGKTLTMLALILATKKDVPTGFSNSTLVVMPLSVLSNWEKQIQDHCKENSLSYCTYHGANRDKLGAASLASYDVVFTTYQTVTGEHVDANDTAHSRKKKKVERPLFETQWKRIVLDEGHSIRNPKTKMAKAVCALSAQRRWVLTGTPIINSPRDLGSILTFLSICKPLDQEDMFKRLLVRPLKDGLPAGVELLRALMNHICIRRTKEMQDSAGNPLVPLPPIEMIKVPVALSNEARKALYDEIEELTKYRLETLMSRGGVALFQSNALAMLTRMRQLALHPGLVPAHYLEGLRKADSGEAQPVKALTQEEKYRLQQRLAQIIEDSEECPICFSIPTDPRITSCGHMFCLACIQEVISRDPKCPMDRCQITMGDLIEPLPPTDLTQPRLRPDEPEEEEKQGSSAKIDQLVHLLQLAPSGEKSLVFSQFTSFLDKIGEALNEKGIPFVRFDGQMSAKRRQEAIARFSVPLTLSGKLISTAPVVEGAGGNTRSARARQASRKVLDQDTPDPEEGTQDDDEFVASSEPDYSDFEAELPIQKGKGKQKQAFVEDELDEIATATHENPAVMLISLKAGALGLNLTVANNVYLMDPYVLWWQEGIESQAIDRVNRIGQTKPIHVYQLISENTVESRVLGIQERKKNLIKQAFSGMKSTETPRQQREARLQALAQT